MPKIDFSDFNVSNTVEYKVALYLKVIDEINNRLNEKIMNIKLMPHQKEFIYSKSKITMLLGGNRSGKTFSGVINLVLVLMDLHPIIKLPKNATVWVIGLDRINHLIPIILPYIFEYLPERLVKVYSKKDGFIQLTNGKVVYLKSCDAGVSKFQSASVDMVWFDEEPPQDIWREVYMRTIDKASHIYITMTPTNGISWSYKEIYQKRDEEDYNIITASTYDNIYLPKSEIEKLDKQLSDDEKEMRIYGAYVDLGGHRVFDINQISFLQKTIKDPVLVGDVANYSFMENNNGYVKIYEKYKPDAYYVLGVDSSEGLGDPTAMVIMEYLNNRISIAATVNRLIPIEQLHIILLQLASLYNYPLLVIERNSTGASLIERVKYNYQGQIFFEERFNEFGDTITKKLGWRTDVLTKSKLIIDLKTFLVERKVIINDEDLWKQLKDYIQDSRGKYKALTGHDDLLIAFALCVQGMLSDQFSVNIRRGESIALKGDLNKEIMKEVNNWFNY